MIKKLGKHAFQFIFLLEGKGQINDDWLIAVRNYVLCLCIAADEGKRRKIEPEYSEYYYDRIFNPIKSSLRCKLKYFENGFLI